MAQRFSLVDTLPEELAAALVTKGNVQNFKSLCGCPFNWHLGMMKCKDSCPVKGLRNHAKFPPFVLLPPGSSHLDQIFFGDRRGLCGRWCLVGEIVWEIPAPPMFQDRKGSVVKTAFGEAMSVLRAFIYFGYFSCIF